MTQYCSTFSSKYFWQILNMICNFAKLIVAIVVIDPFLPLFAIMECHSMTQSCSTFAIKYFWQIVYVLFNFAKLVVVDPYMLCFCS